MNTIITTEAKKQFELLESGSAAIIEKDALLSRLEESFQKDAPLTVKFGIDPSSPDLHLGHLIPLFKLKQFQKLGHRVVIVIGDFTGKIGDPSGKLSSRSALSLEQMNDNSRAILSQIFLILDESKTTVRYNSQWLSDLDFEDILRLASTTSVSQMLEREDFQNRTQKLLPIGLHEFLYPLMQAYDSVELQADIEVGGYDQDFNIRMGQTLQTSLGRKAQIALLMPLLGGIDGSPKMSKSQNNFISLRNDSTDLKNSIAALSDENVRMLCTALSLSDCDIQKEELADCIIKICCR